jgi:hypothetical protein
MRLRIESLLTRNGNFLLFPAVLFFLNVVDVLSTGWGLSRGLVEMNFLFSFSVVPFKFLGCGLLGLASYVQYRLNPCAKAVNVAVLIVIVAYVLVVVNNICCILLVSWA